jgi:capsular exopolysaccharide synthesis family protein
MEKEAEFGIAKAGTIPNFVILSPALNNPNPIYPKKIFIYISGLGIGIFLGISLIAIRYLLNDTISTQKELERSLHASMLGGIPEYSKEKMEVSKLVVDKNPKSAISEALRSIRTNLEFICPNKKKKLIAVTSTVSGEGKTFVASNLSGVIALSNQKVILLDLDMRKPKVHLAFEKENFKGMSTVLIGKHTLEECIQPTSISNLSFISAGPTPPNPSELILREEFDLLIKRLFEIYDVVVIDTPPVGLVTDGILILRKADIPLYVVRTDYSKKSAKRNINKLVKTIPKLCVLMNALKAINTYGYGGYGYGYGYGYYEGETEKETIISKIKSLAGVKA